MIPNDALISVIIELLNTYTITELQFVINLQNIVLLRDRVLKLRNNETFNYNVCI